MQIIKAARGNITGHFGDENVTGAHVKRHGGMDIGHGNETADDLRVIAPASGTIVFAGRLGTYGNCIQIDHGDGWGSLLAHLAGFKQTGGEVSQGEHIATMGDTGGDWPVHLHQELRRNGVQLDPEDYLASTPAGGTGTPITPTTGAETMGLVVKIKDGEPRGGGDVFFIDKKHIVHLGNDEDVDRAVRLSGRPKAVQTRAELDTFAAILGIPGSQIKRGVKYFG